jgi:hypothetical protein
LDLRKRKTLVNVGIRKAAPKSMTEREKAVATYILDTDAFEQIIDHARNKLNWLDERPLGGDIVIGVGGEVVVSDVDDNEFEGDAALDTYSSISIEADTKDPAHVDDNNDPSPCSRPAWSPCGAPTSCSRKPSIPTSQSVRGRSSLGT